MDIGREKGTSAQTHQSSLIVVLKDDLLIFDGTSVGDTDGGMLVVVLTRAVIALIFDVKWSIAPLVKGAFVECDADPEDIFWIHNLLMSGVWVLDIISKF